MDVPLLTSTMIHNPKDTIPYYLTTVLKKRNTLNWSDWTLNKIVNMELFWLISMVMETKITPRPVADVIAQRYDAMFGLYVLHVLIGLFNLEHFISLNCVCRPSALFIVPTHPPPSGSYRGAWLFLKPICSLAKYITWRSSSIQML